MKLCPPKLFVSTFLAALLFVPAGALMSQVKGAATTDRNQTTFGKSMREGVDINTLAALKAAVLPMEDKIEPASYVVGPGDVITVGIWGGTNLVYPMPVSAEGTLLVPEIGEFPVAGKTLAAVKREVSSAIKEQYRLAKPTVSLATPREVIVTVFGAVRNPGPYILSAAYRVDKAVALANLLTNQDATLLAQQQISTGSMPKPPEFSRRNIMLRRKQEERDRAVDLDLYKVFRRDDDNPQLREGDIIIVPPLNIGQGSVSVYGAVNSPGQYEYREGDSLWALIRIADGFSPNADTTTIELTRLSVDGTRSVSSTTDLRPVISGQEPDIPLMARDRIVVRERIDRRKDFKAYVQGEVLYPGVFPITPDSTRLSEVIRRAGGFTGKAFLARATLHRKQETPQGDNVNLGQDELLNLRMNDQIVTPEERSYFDLESSLRKGQVAVDFEGLFVKHDSSKDVILRDGDLVFIPSSERTVYVIGQVPNPGFVPYLEGAGVEYYIQKAGGFGAEAETGGVRTIKGKTREWLDPSDTTVEPGDFIWVPKDIKYPTAYYMNIASQAASLASVVLSMTLIVIQLTK